MGVSCSAMVLCIIPGCGVQSGNKEGMLPDVAAFWVHQISYEQDFHQMQGGGGGGFYSSGRSGENFNGTEGFGGEGGKGFIQGGVGGRAKYNDVDGGFGGGGGAYGWREKGIGGGGGGGGYSGGSSGNGGFDTCGGGGRLKSKLGILSIPEDRVL
ncbi:hypothetical protein AWC38_SpisGene20421 [Stylophora pistillata]|uniref:Uncharacterized protein n=1 Tax=Stylophora pistillata TaxID=50429 RepID=A0A2B4REY0_STYPI|nr:hypothetical protein AWC38_SpisGene20421 [Stylophora pistillata]